MDHSLTAEELKEKYPDPEFRKALIELVALVGILPKSIIDKSFRVPAHLHDPIVLTDAGKRFYEKLKRKNIPYPEARLICLLEFAHIDLFVDVEATDRERLISGLNKEIASRSIQYPFIYGRVLYDRYYDLFSDTEKFVLSSNDTQKLLRDLPQGVFQLHDLVTGPFGLLKSKSIRSFSPDNDVLARHCADLSCGEVHEVHLSTSPDASINENREVATKLLRRDSEPGSEWGTFLGEISEQYIPRYRDWASEPLLVLIGDSLTDQELRSVVEWILDNRANDIRDVAQNLGLTGAPKKITKDLDRARLMQLLFVASNLSITTALDTLIASGSITIPEGEIRRPIVNRSIAVGRYRLQAEASRYGVRIVSRATNIAPLRTKRLVERMYLLDQEKDRQELEWQLRREPADSVEARLEHWLQTRPPKESLRSLVLARHSNVIVATEHMRLIDGATNSDDDILNTLLWKLGYTPDDTYDPHANFWRMHKEMLRLSRQNISRITMPDTEEIRKEAVSYFVALERLLDDVISYTTWVFTNDHYVSEKPFVYRPDRDRLPALKRLNEDNLGNSDNVLTYGEKNGLYALLRGFQRLASVLIENEGMADELVRPAPQLPKWAASQPLQKFPFVHTVPFLDLLPDCRQRIVNNLKEISRRLVAADVSEARNEWLHGRRTPSNLDRLREGLEAVGDAIRLIEDSGFSLRKFSQVRNELDRYGRSIISMADSSGMELDFYRPSNFGWLGFPGLAEPHCIVTSARFAEPNEVLRFTVEHKSPFSGLWDNYPLRPVASEQRITNLARSSS